MTTDSSVTTDLEPAVPAADEAIRVATLAAAGLGVPGIFYPGVDETGMAAIWLTMVTAIAKRCGAPLTPVSAGKFVTSAVRGVAAYTLGSKMLTWAAAPLLLAFPPVGVPVAVGLNSALNALFTYRLGKECVRLFSNPDFSLSDLVQVKRGLTGLPSRAEMREIRRVLGRKASAGTAVDVAQPV